MLSNEIKLLVDFVHLTERHVEAVYNLDRHFLQTSSEEMLPRSADVSNKTAWSCFGINGMLANANWLGQSHVPLILALLYSNLPPISQ